MNILLTGAAGQLGQELLPLLTSLGSVRAADRVPAPGATDSATLDLSDAASLDALLEACRPDLVVNAAAYTAVDQAENEPELAHAVNATLPARLANWAAANDAGVVHYSTDYVFDGSLGRDYTEADEPAPLNVYGASKLAGEQAVINSGCRHLVLRSSWIYAAHGKNFVLTMLELARSRPSLSVVADQVGCPTWARNLANYSLAAIRSRLLGPDPVSGLFHCADADAVSWFDFAARVFDIAGEQGLLDQRPDMQPVPSEGFPQLALRPKHSALDSRLAARELGFRQAGLAESLSACLEELNHA